MQWTMFKIYITTVYQFTPDITSSLDILWFTYNPKWLVMCMLVSILVQGASGCGAQSSQGNRCCLSCKFFLYYRNVCERSFNFHTYKEILTDQSSASATLHESL